MPILRWRASEKVDTVGYLPFELHPGAFIHDGVLGYRHTEVVAFPQRARWVVSADGRVAIVHSGPYRIDWILPSGHHVQGREIPYTREKVTEEHKAQWRANRPGPIRLLSYPRDGGPPAMVRRTRRLREPDRWPAYLPPLGENEPGFDRLGRLWVERSSGTPGRTVFDIFDRDGKLVFNVRAAGRFRLVGFGARHAYLVVRGQGDVEFLTRFALP
jgi:hypothetical protein